MFPVAPLGTRSVPAPRSRARRPRLTPSPPPAPRRSAAARAGKSVLQLDPADAYGGAFGALAESPGGVGWDVPSSANLERRAATRDGDASEKSDAKSDADEDAETAIVFPALGAPVDARARLGATSYCSPATPSGSSRRQFSLDRSGPRLALGADAFVDVLVRSGAHAYVEFKALDATAIFSRDARGTPGFRAVPASRAEVFRDKTLGLTEKRALMRVLKRVVRLAERGGVVVGAGDPDAADAAVGAPGSEWRAASDGSDESLPEEEDPIAPLYEREDELFSVALERLGLGPPRASASPAVRFALALSGDDAETARRGFESLTTYLASLHRFGPDVGAALLPLYGAAEFPQAFARLAAVRGATCALRVGARRAYVESTKPEPNASDATEPVEGVVTVLTEGGQRLRCRALGAAADATTLVPSPAKAKASQNANATRATRWISRAVAVVDGACVFFPSEGEGEAHAPEEEGEEGSAARSKRERSTLAVFPPGSVRGAPAGAAIRVAQLGAATGACPRVQPKEDENARGGWRVLQASVASSHPRGSAEDDLRGVLELLADTSSLRGYGAETRETPSEAATESADVSVAENDAENAESAKEKETIPRAEIPRASSSERRSRPRAVWVSFHREVAPDDAQTFVASWSALPRNVVTCPGPDARADFADLVAVAEAAAARLWGVEASKRFFSPAAPERDDVAAGAADRGTRTGDSDEDEMDALLRDLPGGIGA